MHRSNNTFSKSTKRRRLLEEKCLQEHLIEIDNAPVDELAHITNNITSSESIESTSGLVISEINESSSLNIIEPNPVEDNSYVFLEKSKSDNDSSADGTESESDEHNSQQQPLTSELADWAVNHNVQNSTFSNLLKILKKHKCFNDFPSDARTVFSNYSGISYNKKVDVTTVPPGMYYHFGILNGIKKHIDKDFSCDTIKLVVGVDGLPLTKSSSSTFWPILGYIRQTHSIVFPIGIYWGNEKPHDSNIFMKNFNDELKDLIVNGVSIEVCDQNNRYITSKKKIIIDAFCCDSPAKSFLLKTKGHTGFYSCSRCTVQGKFIQRRVCFPDLDCSKRTHSDFVNTINEEHHISDTELINIPGIDIIQNFPLDYMHLVCLGVVRKLLLLWKGSGDIGRVNVNSQKLPTNVIKLISSRLLLVKKDIPNEFSRKPRSLDDLPRWKATEYRQFLLYTGIIVLYSIIPKTVYNNFLYLHVAMIIFLSPNYNHLATLQNHY